jgi:hypothetical protein
VSSSRSIGLSADDSTARVWKNFKSKIIIKLEMAVWGVKLVGEDRLLTGKHVLLLCCSELTRKPERTTK